MLVMITGASTGIGRASARAFVENGSRVIGLARRTERLEDLARELGGPDRFLPVTADVADAAAMETAVEQIRGKAGVPDVIVANAGIGLDALFSRTTDNDLRELFEVNVFGAVRTVRPFVEEMRKRGSGRILFVSSIVGKRGIPYYSAYSASKFALHGMAESLRTELFGSGVTVGLVCPSSTESEFDANRRRVGPSQSGRRVRRHSAESVARAIVSMAGSRRRERILSLEAKLLASASYWAPGLVDRLLARVLRGSRPE